MTLLYVVLVSADTQLYTKHALLTPIPKVTNPCDIENNFRQISILPQIARIIENLQLNRPNRLVKNNQHAFKIMVKIIT